MPPVDPLMKALMEVKMLASRSRKEAEKANKTRLSEENKASRAMKNHEFQIAQIHSQSAVREHHRYVSLRAEAAEAEVLVNDLKAAYSTRERARSLAYASKALEGASRTINLERVLVTANSFLERSQDFKIASSAIRDVSQGVQEQSLGGEGKEEVERLMQKLADEAGVDMREHLEANAAPAGEVGAREGAGKQREEEDGLDARLRALRA
ncbi:SNF7 family protein Fti1/Did2 [Blastomyces dermatitidis ATCC 18188]|uniref:SNF7 family protein Fti1/Did2 n=1 Tax=Ajellomyces dermatitidis (strain ATCC 18188 / CBS 674.68) TaxID=653446 RepID=F2TNQ4_AJEDA|nr:SNF7 family protein Fti1/Did2 [Blastomyces dermatitidis ATCC 18188]